MENQVNSKNIILNYGLIYGGVIVFINLIIYALGMTFDTTGGIINMIACIEYGFIYEDMLVDK